MAIYGPSLERLLVLSGVKQQERVMQYGVAFFMGMAFLVCVCVILWPALQQNTVTAIKYSNTLSFFLRLDELSCIFLAAQFLIGLCCALWARLIMLRSYLWYHFFIVWVYFGDTSVIMGLSLACLLIVQFYKGSEWWGRDEGDQKGQKNRGKIFLALFFLFVFVSIPKHFIERNLSAGKNGWGRELLSTFSPLLGGEQQALAYSLIGYVVFFILVGGALLWTNLYEPLDVEEEESPGTLGRYVGAMIVAQGSGYILLRYIHDFPFMFLTSEFIDPLLIIMGVIGCIHTMVMVCLQPGLSVFLSALPRLLVSQVMVFIGVAHMYLWVHDPLHAGEMIRACLMVLGVVFMGGMLLLIGLDHLLDKGGKQSEHPFGLLWPKKQIGERWVALLIILFLQGGIVGWQILTVAGDCFTGSFWGKMGGSALLAAYGFMGICFLFIAYHIGLELIFLHKGKAGEGYAQFLIQSEDEATLEGELRRDHTGKLPFFWKQKGGSLHRFLAFLAVAGLGFLCFTPLLWFFLFQRIDWPFEGSTQVSSYQSLLGQMVWYHIPFIKGEKSVYTFSLLGSVIVWLGVYAGARLIWMKERKITDFSFKTSSVTWKQGIYFTPEWSAEKQSFLHKPVEPILWYQALVRLYYVLSQSVFVRTVRHFKRFWRLQKTIAYVYSTRIKFSPDASFMVIAGVCWLLFILYLRN